MKNIKNDLKVIGIIFLFCIMYSSIVREEFSILNILSIIDVLIIFCFVLYIISAVATYSLKLKYINNLYRYLSICFLSVGMLSFSYICFKKQIHINNGFENSCISIEILAAILESCYLIYCFSNYKNNINTKRFLAGTLLISICTIYICSALSILPLYEVDNLYIKSIILICFSICILLKIYLLRVIKKSGTDITESMALYLKMYMYLSIISIIIELNVYMNISSELIFIYYLIRALSSYCIVKIILVEILKTPQEYLYKNLVKKSEDLEATILELKKTIDDKNIIYKDYEKRTKHEEVKNEVLANISHEFKTPVNVIYSAVQTQDLIKNTANIEELLKYNKIIKQNCNRLTRLINNFIDTTRFEKENVKTEFTCENIVEITEYLTMCVVPFANSKKLNLIFDTSDEELYSLIDKELYDRMILNLLSNAIKYSRINGNIKGMIKDDNKFIKITIEDDGIGIDKYHLKDIFSIFERVDKSYSRNTEGSGLGLNIAKKIIDIHNGNISIESIKEKGTSVIVSIPKCSEKYVDNISHRLQDNTYVKYEVEVEMSDIY